MEKEEGGVYPKNNVYFSSDESDTETHSPNKTSDKHSPPRKTRSKEKVKVHYTRYHTNMICHIVSELVLRGGKKHAPFIEL